MSASATLTIVPSIKTVAEPRMHAISVRRFCCGVAEAIRQRYIGRGAGRRLRVQRRPTAAWRLRTVDLLFRTHNLTVARAAALLPVDVGGVVSRAAVDPAALAPTEGVHGVVA